MVVKWLFTEGGRIVTLLALPSAPITSDSSCPPSKSTNERSDSCLFRLCSMESLD